VLESICRATRKEFDLMPTEPAVAPTVRVDVNDVNLVARITTAPTLRALPSGDEVVAFGVSVRRPTEGVDALPVQVGPAPPAGSRPRAGQVGRRVLQAAARLKVDDRVEVRGRLQRRWWDAGGVRRSRIEVVASSVERVAADAAPVASAPAARAVGTTEVTDR
jgi:single-strand DNA-binding protein